MKQFQVMSSQLNTLTDIWSLTDLYPKDTNEFKHFYLSIHDGKASIFVNYEYVVYWDEDNRNLSALLGFPPFGIMPGKNPGYTEYIAPLPFGLGSPILAFIYCDLVEYNYIGDSMSPCLRTLSINTGGLHSTVIRYENPHYVPVAFNRFSHVSIEIGDELGEDIKFTKGISLIKLHFRPKRDEFLRYSSVQRVPRYIPIQ